MLVVMFVYVTDGVVSVHAGGDTIVFLHVRVDESDTVVMNTV